MREERREERGERREERGEGEERREERGEEGGHNHLRERAVGAPRRGAAARLAPRHRRRLHAEEMVGGDAR